MTVLESDLEVDSLPAPHNAARSNTFIRVWICLGIFIVLMIWAVAFPFSGDGDSVLHYLNARETAGNWALALFAWTRPGYKIPLSLFASHGILAAHFFNAMITVALAWNTMRLADELRIPRASMAGVFLILQPFVFALGSDTMTELPMALGLVLAVRWWRNERHFLACLMAGYLPSVRPEGFFIGLIFGIMVLALFVRNRRRESGRSLLGDIIRTTGLMGCLSAGLAVWVLLCWRYGGDALLVLRYWSWPPGSYAFYGSGTIWHYLIYWPVYCGLPLFVLFLAGIRPSFRRSMRLPWVVWFTVIGVHTILYWRGWFASCGLIRIMACSSPMTALICLYGWNSIAERLSRRMLRPAAIVFFVTATAWVIGNYFSDRNRLHFLPIRRCAAYVQQNHLFDGKHWFFAGDKIATAMLQGPNIPADHIMDTPCDADQIKKNLAALPIGSIGIWDTEQAPVWHGQTIEDLTTHGFTILYETHTNPYSIFSIFTRKPARDMTYVVLRKDGPFTGN